MASHPAAHYANLGVYSLDDNIRKFFADKTSTREECDKRAAELGGEPVLPVPVQGASSYTVMTGGGPKPIIVQFRARRFRVVEELAIEVARMVHGSVVPEYVHSGHMGKYDSGGLAIYTMDTLPGVNYILNRHIPSLTSAAAKRMNTVSDLAGIFAAAWNMPQPVTKPAIRKSPLDRYTHKLRLLASRSGLPRRFTCKLHSLERALPSLFFSKHHPFVLSHPNLNITNLLVYPHTGHITGVPNWQDARVLPFGFGLVALEDVLGYHDSSSGGCWQYFEDAGRLRKRFWDVFERLTTRPRRIRSRSLSSESDSERSRSRSRSKSRLSSGSSSGVRLRDTRTWELIQVARLVGIFVKFGFLHDGDGDEDGEFVPIDEDSARMSCLDAFVNAALEG
ncbi:hypothetical protein B0H63DRAFT_559243 [Podospora didyma]|uniref:Aminoglycoside phosphotransferase domain-containing protein n=1 Tax=Podospora didyma TaxID=330526 RepID=A0AAE0U251_9PEZI|nr:hypothetical protein B0H63DRAFT_559243 [Podospora didyma]